MQGSFPLPLGKINVGEKEFRDSIDEVEAEKALRNAGVELPETKLNSFLESIPRHMGWLRNHGDRFPWRYTTDPWKIFVAELLLQKSRGDQVADMYELFLKRYESPYEMAQSDEEEVDTHLATIGLNKTKRETFKRASKRFVNNQGGLPSSEEKLREIKGVGQYISRATMLFSFGQRKALSDVNIEGFIESEFGVEVNEEEALKIMESITPDDPGMARSLYFWIIDKDR